MRLGITAMGIAWFFLPVTTRRRWFMGRCHVVTPSRAALLLFLLNNCADHQ